MNVIISESEYRNLLRANLLLKYLESYGVDNWDGYDEAHSEFYDELDSGYIDDVLAYTEKVED